MTAPTIRRPPPAAHSHLATRCDRVLAAVRDDVTGPTVPRLARRLRLTHSATYGALLQLARAGHVERDGLHWWATEGAP